MFKGSIIKAPNGFAAYSLLMVIKTQGLGTPRPNSHANLVPCFQHRMLVQNVGGDRNIRDFQDMVLISPVCRKLAVGIFKQNMELDGQLLTG